MTPLNMLHLSHDQKKKKWYVYRASVIGTGEPIPVFSQFVCGRQLLRYKWLFEPRHYRQRALPQHKLYSKISKVKVAL